MSGILAFLLNLVLNNQQGRYGWVRPPFSIFDDDGRHSNFWLIPRLLQQWILTTVGLVTFVVGVLSFVAIPEQPESAREPSHEERSQIQAAVTESRFDDAQEERESIPSALKGVFTSVSAWLFTVTSIAHMIPVYCFYSYSPTIVSRLMEGKISVRIQLTVIVPVYIIACISNFACGYASDRLRNRSCFIIAGTSLAILGECSLPTQTPKKSKTLIGDSVLRTQHTDRPLSAPDLFASRRG